uniref:Cytochrome C biogenesis protein transmembrane domain-containing protein n=1 Tax=Oryza punctata TaxID=4537 RepID=A0A0E0JH24_ORYPU
MDGGGGGFGLGGLQWTAEEASTIGGIATVSLLHSFIPTHWLPFSIGYVYFVATAFGGVLHVVSTALLGITAVTMANTIAGEETVHKLASLLLIVLGGSYILLFALGKGGHGHAHNHPMEKMAVAGLVLVPALSPCATTLPVFLAVGNSSSMMILAIIVLLFSTITVMTSLVALSFYGASQIKFHWVERYDKILVGSVLCLVGVLTYVFHHHDGDEHSLHEHVHRKLDAYIENQKKTGRKNQKTKKNEKTGKNAATRRADGSPRVPLARAAREGRHVISRSLAISAFCYLTHHLHHGGGGGDFSSTSIRWYSTGTGGGSGHRPPQKTTIRRIVFIG